MIVCFGMPFHGVVLEQNGTGTKGLVDSVALGALVTGSSFSDLIIRDEDFPGVRQDIKSVAGFGIPIVCNLVVFERIAMAAILDRFLSEIYSGNTIARDGIVDEQIVGILVSNGDAVLPVICDHIVFKPAIADAPAEEKPNLPVVMQTAALNQRMGTSGTGMDSVSRVTIGLTIQNLDIVGNLKRDAVSVIVSRHTVLDRGVSRLVKIDGTTPAPIDVTVFILVAVNDQIFENHLFRLNGAKNGKAIPNART